MIAYYNKKNGLWVANYDYVNKKIIYFSGVQTHQKRGGKLYYTGVDRIKIFDSYADDVTRLTYGMGDDFIGVEIPLKLFDQCLEKIEESKNEI